jgi:phosphoribosylaminoimidazolecarboxamide formyltransferase/IMP cyclohydrolase
MIKIKRALISVSNKEGIVDFAKKLANFGVEIISTGGTAKTLAEAGIEVLSISQVTNFPEMLEGRVKTLHPNIHAGILADRSKESHMKAIEEMDIKPIDLVVVNLYPFAETIKRPDVTDEMAVENIDIGGPTMIRSAAKNYKGVAVVTDPGDYLVIVDEIDNTGGIKEETAFRLAVKAFSHTSEYDGLIVDYFSGGRQSFPNAAHITYRKISGLRYGENPHQRASFYRDVSAPSNALVNAIQLHGRELSYNNILDLESAWMLNKEWEEPATVIIKHNNPCGVALSATLKESFEAALSCDPVSAFGGVIAFSKPVDIDTVNAIGKLFVEAIIAPNFETQALEKLKLKKDLRLLRLERGPYEKFQLRRISGGVLVQDADVEKDPRNEMKVVTSNSPTDDQWEDLLFAWTVAKHVKSNAIVLVKNKATVGIGAGQMSRVDSSYIATRKAGEKAKGSVLASDAFFPFPDALEVAIEAGISAAIQPGGSIRDDQVIEAATKANIPMVVTGRRHFKH